MIRGPVVATPVEELLEYKGSVTSEEAAGSLVSPWPRVENCLHNQRHKSIVRKKNRGRIKIVPMKAYENGFCQSCFFFF